MSGGLSNYPIGEYSKLHRAVAKGRIKSIKAQLGLGVDDINAPSKIKGETALIIACGQGNSRVAELLLDHGADVERATPSKKWTALFFAIPHTGAMRVLLERGANHRAKDGIGSSPLHLASAGESGDAGLEAAEVLLEFGADVNAKDNRGNAPLHLLAHKGRPAKGRMEAAKVLVESGANIDAVNGQGCTPLMCTCIYVTGLAPLAEMLVREGANLHVSDTHGLTSLHLLAARDKVCGDELLDIAMLLIKEGANIGATNINGSTPLHVASMVVGNLGLVKLLVERGANPNSRDTTGETPLHLATTAGSFMTMTKLIAAGADVNLRDQRGETPLLKAVLRGHLVAVKMLLRAKASALLPRSGGGAIYPLEVAAELGDTDIVGELLQREGIEGCGGPSVGARALAFASSLPSSLHVMAILLKAGVVDTGEALFNTSELVHGEQADSDQLNILQAARRLLLRAEAVTATSWLWPRGTGAAAPTIKTAAAAPALTAMMPLLRRRAVRRGFALHAMFRCVCVCVCSCGVVIFRG